MHQERVGWSGNPIDLASSLYRKDGESVFFFSDPGFSDGWTTRVAVHPRSSLSLARSVRRPGEPLRRLERILADRRARGGTAHTGLAVLAGYELLGAGDGTRPGPGLPDLHAWQVDSSFTREGDGSVLFSSVSPPEFDPEALLEAAGSGEEAGEPPTVAGVRASTSLPRERYLRSVERIRGHILDGDVYQANLTQRFQVPWRGDLPLLYRRLVGSTPAPRSAFVAAPGFSLASVSPERFLSGARDGTVRTQPIKGTRRRHADPAADRLAAEELRNSEKDHAELLMIVDLERNDLGRICRPGSIFVEELSELRSFAAVHHLVAGVRGRLNADAGIPEILAATFPGGSVTGAPKVRAMEILRELEPVERSFYTGSLFWFGDDGSFDSSILIRSVILAGGWAWLGAGGGIVAESDPEAEWRESNDKARAPAEVLGFVPEEAV